VVAVTHDRYFLDNAAEWILELDRGHGIPWKGNYSSWLEQKEQRLKQEESSESARAEDDQERTRVGAPEPEGAPGQEQGAPARFEELSSHEYQKRNETQRDLHPGGRAPRRQVIEFKGVSKGFGDRLLIDDLSVQRSAGRDRRHHRPERRRQVDAVPHAHRRRSPIAAKIVIGPTVKIAHVDQSRDALEDDKTVWEAVSGGLGHPDRRQVRDVVARVPRPLQLQGRDQQKTVGNLSGGERGRLHLAKTLLAGGNVLLLDEPSNDLDVETLRALEDALLEFAGSVLVISHDRWFLDRIATHILACEGDSHWTFFDGNYQEYEADKKRLGEEGAKPRRIRFKALK
jgi:sulfate-transporting ATPase